MFKRKATFSPHSKRKVSYARGSIILSGQPELAYHTRAAAASPSKRKQLARGLSTTPTARACSPPKAHKPLAVRLSGPSWQGYFGLFWLHNLGLASCLSHVLCRCVWDLGRWSFCRCQVSILPSRNIEPVQRFREDHSPFPCSGSMLVFGKVSR